MIVTKITISTHSDLYYLVFDWITKATGSESINLGDFQTQALLHEHDISFEFNNNGWTYDCTLPDELLTLIILKST